MYVCALHLTMCLMAVLHHLCLLITQMSSTVIVLCKPSNGHSPYEEVQLKDPEPEYSYAAHGVDVNTYDSAWFMMKMVVAMATPRSRYMW